MTHQETAVVRQNSRRTAASLLSMLAVASLAACGGGGSDGSDLVASPVAASPAADSAAVASPVATGTETSSAEASPESVADSATSAAEEAKVAAVSTQGVLCGISGSEYNADESVNLTATYSWTCNAASRVLQSNGVPNHQVGTFPGPGNPNPISVANVSVTYTLAPRLAGAITPVVPSGYALNGVKFDPSTAGTCENSGSCVQSQGTGPWNIEALGQSAFKFGTDDSNGHVQPSGAYHYHGMPEKFITKLGKGTSTMTLVGWASDGFPIYARYGFSTANNASSPVKVVRGSYQLRSQPGANRPSTTTYAMGTFTQDYVYQAGSGDLDECNGRTGVTPEFPGGTYHYFVTDSYPFVSRCVKGSPASGR